VIKVWDVRTGAELLNLSGHGRALLDIAYHPSGQVLASSGYDGTVRLWDAQTGSPQAVWQTDGAVNRLAFTQDGRLLAGSGTDDSMWLWDMDTRNERFRLKGASDALVAVAFSPDGTRVASGGFDSAVYVWDTQSGELMTTLKGNQGVIWQLIYSPLGDTIVTAGERAAWVWDAQTGKQLFLLSSHGQAVRSVTFRPDGKQIATGGDDNVVRLWNAQTGALEALLREENIGKPQGNVSGGPLPTGEGASSLPVSSDQPLYWVAWVAYNTTGDRLVSASGNGLDMYVVDIAELMGMAHSRVTRQMSCAERVQFLNEELVCDT
jgi:WD40 repeat protein